MAFNGASPIIKTEQLSSSSTNPNFEVGTRVWQSGAEYVYVYNGAANTAIGTGKPAVLDITGSLTSGYTVTVSNAASQVGFFAGVPQSTISSGQYGFIMVKGVSLIALDASAVSLDAGDRLALGVDGGFVAAPATLSTSPRYGIMCNSGVTTVGTGKGWIQSEWS